MLTLVASFDFLCVLCGEKRFAVICCFIRIHLCSSDGANRRVFMAEFKNMTVVKKANVYR
jgi:hypothetical protein